MHASIKQKKGIKITMTGIFGAMCAAICSAAVNHSFWWGVLHFFFSWLYVIYWALKYTNALDILKGG